MPIDWSHLPQELISALCAEQRQRWSSGDRVRIEDYLRDLPNLSRDTEALLDLIYSEICLRRELGETVHAEEYVARFPVVQEGLQRLISVETALESFDLADALGVAAEQVSVAGLAAEATEADRVRLALATSPILGRVPLEVVDQLAEDARIRELAPGDVLIEQGAVADFVFLVLAGEVDVRVRDADGESRVLSQFQGETLVGEIGPFTGRPRSACVVAATPTQVIGISAASVRKACLDYPALNAVFYDLIGERLGDRQFDVLCGEELAGYRFEERLGRGGMGVVYRAWDMQNGRQVALKMLRHHLVLNSQSVKRFQQEAAILRTLDHPRIIKYIAEFTALKTFFIVAEYVTGESLQQLLQRRRRLPEPDVRRAAGQLADALAYAHSRNVIHRDLKPANVLVGRDGGIRLMDFGLSKSLEIAGVSSASHIIGTPRYMAPEQLAGSHVDHRADYFALGCVIYELLTGKPVYDVTHFPGAIQRQMDSRLPERGELGTECSDELYGVLRNCLVLDRELRDVDLRRVAGWAAPLTTVSQSD